MGRAALLLCAQGLPTALALRPVGEDVCVSGSSTDALVGGVQLSDAEAEEQTQRVELRHVGDLQLRSTRARIRRPPEGRYLIVVSAFEQFSGARVAIADALALAKQLGRTFVEPVLLHGRVINPFLGRTWVPLRDMMDVDAMRAYYPRWVLIEEFFKLCGGRTAAYMPQFHIVEHARHHPYDQLIVELKHGRDAPILALRSLARRGPQFIFDQSVDGVPIMASPHVNYLAKQIQQTWGPAASHGFVCAQWRTEGVQQDDRGMLDCARAFASAVLAATQCQDWGGWRPKVLLLSDVREGTSDTMDAPEARREIASFLQGRLRFRDLGRALEPVADRGVRGLVEQALCARSRVLVACPPESGGQNCGRCSRTQSKFAHLLLEERARLGLPAPVRW